MKKILYNPIVKAAVMLLFAASLFVAAFNGLRCAWFLEVGYYNDNAGFFPLILLRDDSLKVFNSLDDCLMELYDEHGANFDDYGVKRSGELTYPEGLPENNIAILKNYTSDKSNFIFQIYLEGGDGAPIISNTDERLDRDDYDRMNYFGRWYMVFDVRDPLIAEDDYSAASMYWWDIMHGGRFRVVAICFGATLLTLLLLSLSIHQAGRNGRDGEVRLYWIERIPAELPLAIKSGIVVLLANALYYYIAGMPNRFISAVFEQNVKLGEEYFIRYAIAALLFVLTALTFLWILHSFAKRVRAGGWYRNTLCFMILHFCWRILCFGGRIIAKAARGLWTIIKNIRLLWKWAVVSVGYFIFTLITILARDEMLVLLWCLASLILGLLGCWFIISLARIRRGTEVIASGKLDEPIDTRGMGVSLIRYAGLLNHIGDSIGKAVEEQMKSERLRTELITNVSHDLKTPLTSIITYVDLIKKENPESETIRGYIDVLERQSGKLKKLTEDLLEASKASSGTLPTELCVTDSAELLTQAVGEYSERFAAARIEPVLSVPEDGAFILADGRHLWRIFDNIFSNICKYSLPGTRAYCTIGKSGGQVNMTFRNISSERLTQPAENLTERFVRGDSSRHSEGSGLGLAIAKSLAELQQGSFEVAIDGDLFKVMLRFAEHKPERRESGQELVPRQENEPNG